MIIAIDGPSGTGKSTVAKQLATKLGFIHLNTGAIYRSFAWYILENHIDYKQDRYLQSALHTFSFIVKREQGQDHYFVNQREVTHDIYGSDITELSSHISVFPSVRKKLVSIQRRLAKSRDVVCEGRDIGSVVFPKAEVKFYLTADPKIRAERRWHELQTKYPTEAEKTTIEEIYQNQEKRDTQDRRRKTSPLVCTPDAIRLDTSDLSISEVVGKMLQICHKREQIFQGPGWLSPRKMTLLYRLVLFTSWIFFVIFHRYRVYGRENFHSGQALVVANHASFYDPPIIALSAPEEISFLARKSLFNLPMLSWLIRRLNTYPVSQNTSNLSVFKHILQILKEGKKVLLFPEGTRSPSEEIQPLRNGIGLLVIKSGAFILPTYIYGTYNVWNRSQRFPKLFGKVACVFGSPIYYHEFSSLDKKSIPDAVRDRVEDALKNLQEWYKRGAIGIPP